MTRRISAPHKLLEAHKLLAGAIARNISQTSPAPRGTRTRPQPADLIHADGKVITPLLKQPSGTTRKVHYVDTETGELTVEKHPVRTDPDAKTHTVAGDTKQVHGSKFWHAAWRGDRPHERVILTVAHVPGVKHEANSEADIAVRELKTVQPPPDILGVLTDGVLRGTHIDDLQRNLGWLVISPVTAAKVNKSTGARTEKEAPLETVTFDYLDGTSEIVELWYRAGRICQRLVTGDGIAVLRPLERVQNEIRDNRDGTFRSYVLYRVQDPRGGKPKIIRQRTFTDDSDRAAGLNRAENVRQIPPGDPSYDLVYGRREDAESINRGIDDHGYLQRARSVGAKRQLFDLLCHAIRTNAIAKHLYGSATTVKKQAA